MGYLNKDRKPPGGKLLPSDVVQIKIEQEKLIKKMADKFKVKRTAIRMIYLEKTWRHIKIRRVY